MFISKIVFLIQKLFPFQLLNQRKIKNPEDDKHPPGFL
ncbi:hypothetical protein LEP1GSC072_0876 [Leptospira noguchii str. Bonito]|nr:hypothetical protein LEP1GSC072_0876 [Leptospira noguchii str. Bonito]